MLSDKKDCDKKDCASPSRHLQTIQSHILTQNFPLQNIIENPEKPELRSPGLPGTILCPFGVVFKIPWDSGCSGRLWCPCGPDNQISSAVSCLAGRSVHTFLFDYIISYMFRLSVTCS